MKMNKTWQRAVIYLIIILTLLSCRLPLDLLNQASGDQPTEVNLIEPTNTFQIVTLQPTDTIAPTPTLTPTPDPLANYPDHIREAMLWETALSDDFSDNKNEWFIGEIELDEQLLQREITAGQYHLSIERLQDTDQELFVKSFVHAQIADYKDFYLVVSVGLVEGDMDTVYGVEFRNSVEGGYQFRIREDSFQLLAADFESESVLIDWTTSGAILPGGMNKLEVVANGDKITLSINETVVADLTDTTYSTGVTLLANEISATGERSTVAFDDLTIKTRAATIYQDVSSWPVAIEDMLISLKDGWFSGSESTAYYDINASIENGQYLVEATPKQDFIWFRIPEGMDVFSDAYLSVDVKPGSNPEGSYAGLLFRNRQEGFYLFRAGKFGENYLWFDVLMLYQNQWQTLVPRYYDASKAADEMIRLGVIANGSVLLFLINDDIVTEIENAIISEGTAGVAIGMDEGVENGTWMFSNYKVQLPGDEALSIQDEPLPEITATMEQIVQPSATTEMTEESEPTSDQQPTEASSVVINPKDGAELILIPEGEFLMGYEGGNAEEDEGPEHPVFLDSYWINKIPVTNSQYRQCIQDGGCTATLDRFPDDPFPVVRVSWEQADDYCHWAGGRIPTEAEWEKAARSTDERIYPWGDDAPNCSLANYKGCYNSQLTEAGRFPEGASPYGVLDMLGTVWEWVGDWYNEEYYLISPYQNPTGPISGEFKVQRGHSFESDIIYLRLTDRARSDPDKGDYRKGFRCVFDEQP